jgi:hypothetical protein
VALISAIFVASASVAQARLRSCGRLRGGNVVIVKGSITCRNARQVLNYAATHFSGNGPASPRGWECFRISGERTYNGDECVSPPGAESHPRRFIQLRYRY